MEMFGWFLTNLDKKLENKPRKHKKKKVPRFVVCFTHTPNLLPPLLSNFEGPRCLAQVVPEKMAELHGTYARKTYGFTY